MTTSLVRVLGSSRVVNVVIVPDGAQGDALVQRAGQWVSAGLMDPVLWVRPADVHEHEHLPARIDAIVIGKDEEGSIEFRKVPFFHTLGLEPATEVLVVSVRWSVASDEENERTARAARVTRQLVDDARALPGQSPSQTRLRSMSVLVSPTLMASTDIERLIDPEWQQTIVVAPEDRPRPQSSDRFVDLDDTDTWIGFALASVCALAGLWTGQVGSPVPAGTGRESAGPHSRVQVARTFSRIVITDDYMDELAVAAARALSSPIIPETVDGVRVLSSLQAEEAVAAATQSLLGADAGALRYAGLDRFDATRTRRVGLWNSTVSFLRFSVEKVAALPVWAWGWLADRLGRGTQASLYGKDTDIVVDARRDLGLSDAPRELLEVHRTMQNASDQVRHAMTHPRASGPRQQQTQIWEIMRHTVFALVDGGPSQSRVLGHEVGGVVPDVGMVIPAPSDTWTLPPQVAEHLGGDPSRSRIISWTDLGAARDLAEHLAERAQDLQQRVQDLQVRATTAQSDLMTAERDFVEARDLLEDLKVELADKQDQWELAKEGRS